MKLPFPSSGSPWMPSDILIYMSILLLFSFEMSSTALVFIPKQLSILLMFWNSTTGDSSLGWLGYLSHKKSPDVSIALATSWEQVQLGEQVHRFPRSQARQVICVCGHQVGAEVLAMVPAPPTQVGQQLRNSLTVYFCCCCLCKFFKSRIHKFKRSKCKEWGK